MTLHAAVTSTCAWKLTSGPCVGPPPRRGLAPPGDEFEATFLQSRRRTAAVGQAPRAFHLRPEARSGILTAAAIGIVPRPHWFFVPPRRRAGYTRPGCLT